MGLQRSKVTYKAYLSHRKKESIIPPPNDEPTNVVIHKRPRTGELVGTCRLFHVQRVFVYLIY